MPILDGLGLAKRIRADNRFKDLAIVAITANIIKDNIDACYDAGMNDFLTKPVELAKLKSLLMEYSTTMVNAHIEAKKPSEVASDSFDQLDIALLNAMLGDDPTVHCMVFNAFLQTAGEQVKLISAYAASANYADLSFQAHGLKSSSKSVSALTLADICQQVETLAAKGSVTAEHVSDLEQCFNEVLIQLTRYCEYYE
jgi:CheY-like chemotaxis protein